MLKHVETMTGQDLHTRYTPTSSRKSQAGYRPLFSINGMVPSSGLGTPANDQKDENNIIQQNCCLNLSMFDSRWCFRLNYIDPKVAERKG
jgi:hypothetical protein